MNLRFTISRKLLALSAIALFFVVVEGAAGWVAANSLGDATRQILDDGAALKYQMQADMAHDALRADVLASLLQGDAQATARKDLDEHARQFQSALHELEQLQLDHETRTAVREIRPLLDEYVAIATSVVSLAAKDKGQAQDRMGAFMVSFKKVEQEMGELSDLIAKRSKDVHARSAEAARMALWGILTAMLLCAAVLLVASMWLSRSIVTRVRRAVEIAETVAQGDLSSRIEVRGEDEAAQLLQALARMNGSLVQLVGTVRQASENIASGTTQIATGNQDLSQRTEEQASNLQQTAASMEQISATVRSNADTTQQASQMAATASQSAARSGEAVQTLVTTMSGITVASRRITDIIGVIDDIAFQTNILALNAAVEAARAGEQGRGFAVVAAEVRTLAQRSATAAKEIKSLIQASAEQVSAGERQASHAGQSMGDVVEQVRQMTLLLADIASATHEQNKGITEVSQAVTQIDQVTQSNASLVEESAAAAESLNRQATRLVDAVAQFRLDGGEHHVMLPA